MLVSPAAMPFSLCLGGDQVARRVTDNQAHSMSDQRYLTKSFTEACQAGSVAMETKIAPLNPRC